MDAPAATEALVLDWLASQRDAMLDLVRALVDIDSGSYDKAGVDAVGARLRAFLSAHDIASSVIGNDRFGDAIRAQVDNVAGGAANAPVLLLGHRDTVFPAGEAGRRPFYIVDGHGSGPGCCDMKAGVVINAFVLAALARFAAAPSPVTALFTADEEIGIGAGDEGGADRDERDVDRLPVGAAPEPEGVDRGQPAEAETGCRRSMKRRDGHVLFPLTVPGRESYQQVDTEVTFPLASYDAPP